MTPNVLLQMFSHKRILIMSIFKMINSGNLLERPKLKESFKDNNNQLMMPNLHRSNKLKMKSMKLPG